MIAPIIVAVALLASTTVIQGLQTERWHDLTNMEELQAMAEQLEHVPLSFGEWEGEIVPDTPELLKQYEKARVNGHVNIRYQHIRAKQREVHVSLVTGHRRHVAVHTPDQCMVGAGFKQLEEEREESVMIPSGESVTVKTSQFIKIDPQVTQNQRILWCWSADGEWIAPAIGRIGLTGQTGWYKLYVTTIIPGQHRVPDIEESKEFMRQYIPVLNKALFPPPAEGDDQDGET